MSVREWAPASLKRNRLLRGWWRRFRMWRWRQAGRPAPPPPSFKQALVRQYARRFGLQVFVETGTWHGEMVEAQRGEFRQLYSIELDRQLYEKAQERFAGYGRISIVPGDSGLALPFVLKQIDTPALFWLDAHAMVGGVSGELLTPIRAELEALLQHHPLSDDVILIDDARLFVGGQHYPTLDEIRERIHQEYPAWFFGVEDDVIRIHR